MTVHGPATRADILGNLARDKIIPLGTGLVDYLPKQGEHCTTDPKLLARLEEYRGTILRFLGDGNLNLFLELELQGRISIGRASNSALVSLFKEQRLHFEEANLDEGKVHAIKFPFRTDSLGEDTFNHKGLKVSAGPINFVEERLTTLVPGLTGGHMSAIRKFRILNGNHRTAAALLRSKDPRAEIFFVRYESRDVFQQLFGHVLSSGSGSDFPRGLKLPPRFSK